MSVPAIDPRAPRRRTWLAVAGAATLAATLWAALQDDDTSPVGPARKASIGSSPRSFRAASPPPAAAGMWPALPDAAGRTAWPAALPQGLAAWSGPPPPPAPPPSPTAARDAAAAPAAAPAFPYALIGRLDDGEPRALLSGPLRSFGVKAAEVIDGQWRVDAVLPNGLTVTWLPGGSKKTLSFAPT